MGDNSMFYDDPKKLSFPFTVVDKFSGAVKEMAKSVADFEKSKEIVLKISSAVVLPEFTGYGIKEVIKGVVPSKSNSYRIVTSKSKDPLKKKFSRLAKTTGAKSYETSFILQCRKYRNANIDCDFNFEIDVYYPSRRADLDNSLKAVLDLLQLVRAIKNDNRTQQIIARRHIDKNDPRIEFSITKANQ